MRLRGIVRQKTVAAMILVAACRQSDTTPPAAQSGAPDPAVRTETGSAIARSSTGAPPAASVAPIPAKEQAPSPKPAGLQPLDAGASPIALAVAGYRDAVVHVPNGATEPRSFIIALHGNFDRPEWQCDVWREVSGGRPFILCPRGSPRTDVPRSLDRWTYDGAPQTLSEIEAGSNALRDRFGAYLESGATVLVAFSLGAIYASHFVIEHADDFPRLVLIEGGFNGWSRWQVAQFAKHGGERVLIACAQTACRNAAKAAQPAFEKGGVDYRFTYAAGAGHTYDGEVARQVAEQWNWLTGPRAAPDAGR